MSNDKTTNTDNKQEDKKQRISTKGKFASGFIILCLTTVMLSYQNCGMVAENTSNSVIASNTIDFTDANNCGVAEFDMTTMGLSSGKAQIGMQYIGNSPTAFIAFPLPGAGGILDANGTIDDIPGASWYTFSNPPTYQIEIPIDSLSTLQYEERQNKLPSKMKSNGTLEHRGQYLYGFNKQPADVKYLGLDQYQNLDGRLYYRNSTPHTLGLLVTSEDLPKIPQQTFLKLITPSKELNKCNQTLGHVAYVMVEDEDDQDAHLANNGIYLSLMLDKLAR